jgi:hypothetical protein
MKKTVLGSILVGVAMMIAACATAPLAPATANVTGDWAGTWQYENIQLGVGELRGTFQQDGNTLTGHFNVTGPVVNRTATISGTVSGNEVLLSSPSSGRLTVSGAEMNGTINGLNIAKVTLRKM